MTIIEDRINYTCIKIRLY